MIRRNVGTLLERQSIDAVGSIEHAVQQYAVHVEIWLYLVLADVQHGFLHLSRIVEAVVWFQLEAGTLGLLCKRLDGLRFCIGLGLVGTDQLLQEIVDVVWRLGHGVVQRIGGIAGITHQLGLFGTQLGHLAHNLERVVLRIGTVGTMNRGLVNLFAQFAIVKRGQRGLLRGVHDDNGIRCLATTTLCILLALSHIGVAHTCQIFLLVHPHNGVVGGSLQQVAPLLLQVADAQVDLLHASHLVVRQKGTFAHKVLVDFLQQLLVFTRQLVVLFIIHLLDTLEQRLVKRNLVLEVGQHGLHLLLNLAQFVRLVGLGQGKENGGDTCQLTTAVLEGQDGILERCRVLTVHDGLNVVTRLLHSRLEGWQVVRGLNLAEIRRTKG